MMLLMLAIAITEGLGKVGSPTSGGLEGQGGAFVGARILSFQKIQNPEFWSTF